LADDNSQQFNSRINKIATKAGLIKLTNIPSSTFFSTLHDMEAIGLVMRKKGGRRPNVVGGQTPDEWYLADKIKKLWAEVELR